MTPLLSLDDARAMLLAGYGRLGTETVELAAAAGRALAQPLIASHDQPPAAISAMDGYAVRTADLEAGVTLRLIGEAPAGQPFGGTVGVGQCVRIATGGALPDGADRVVMQENAQRDGEAVLVLDASGPPFVRAAGMDFATGDALLEAGRRIGPAEIGLIAAAGVATVLVARKPRVAILANGDELLEPGAPLAPGAVYNSAAFALAALVEAWGGTAVRPPTLPDALEPTVAAIADLADIDLYLPLGGASVGEHDLLRPAFEALGAELKFWRIAVMPGKPSWHARLPDGRPVLGLPGNPASAFVTAHLLLKPLMEALLGNAADTARPSRASLAEALPANGAREAWLRALVTPDSTGRLIATVDPRQDSNLQAPLAAANALVRRVVDAPPARVGDLVEYLPLQQA